MLQPEIGRPIDSSRFVVLYGTRPISADSTYAVARLLGEFQNWLEAEYPAAEVILACPRDVASRAREQGTMGRLLGRLGNSRTTRKFRNAVGLETLDPNIQRVFRQLRTGANKPTVVVCARSTDVLAARRYLPRCKVVYWIHSLPGLGQEQLTVRALSEANAVVVTSKTFYHALWELVCRKEFRPPVWIIPTFVDSERFRPPPDEERRAIRAQLGLNDDTIAVAHMGRSPEKGLQIVESALPLVETIQRTIRVISLGGRQRSLSAIGRYAEIVEIGRIAPADVNRVLQGCDLGVVPSVWWENFPLAAIEMMAVGLCVVASRAGGIPELIEHNETGLLVDCPNDVEAWARAIERVVSDDQLRAKLGQNAYQAVSKQLGREQFFAKCKRLLQNLATN